MKRLTYIKTRFPRECGIMQSITAVILLSLLLSALQYACCFTAEPTGILSFLTVPLLPLMNALPLICVMLIVYGFTNRVWAGYLTAAVPLFALLTVNYFKVYFRAETLSVHDFSLVSEAADIVTGYTLPFPAAIIISAVIAAAAFFAVFKYIKTKRTPRKQRLILAAAAAAAGLCGFFVLFGNQAVYEAMPSFANQFSDVAAADHKGFIFAFLSHTSSYDYAEPNGYDIGSVPYIGASEPDDISAPEKKVNVIAVMSESFFDMEACKGVRFNGGMSPTPNLDRLRADSLSGYILVPGYAGSTASTEFEFLTGINISRLDSAMPVVYKTHVTRNAYSLARMFGDLGYTTEAFHPGKAWFYNRAAVYPRLGFQNAYFQDSYEYSRDDLVNYYISDKVTADRIISEYDDYIKSGADNGYFSFTVTIQNHGPYSTEEPAVKRPERTDGMSDEEYNLLCNYANGLYDADTLLGRVCDYAETVSEPTAVVFFGDHLPYFDSQGAALSHLGLDVSSASAEAVENRYSTPFIIHGNAALRNMKSDSARGNIGHISSCFLASALLEYIGMDAPPYFKAIGEIGRRISGISGSFYIVGGNYSTSLKADDEKLLTYLDYLSYWALRGYNPR